MGSWGHGLLGSDMGSWGQTWEAVQEFPFEIYKSLPSNGLRISSLIKVVSLLARTYGKKRRILGQPPSRRVTTFKRLAQRTLPNWQERWPRDHGRTHLLRRFRQAGTPGGQGFGSPAASPRRQAIALFMNSQASSRGVGEPGTGAEVKRHGLTPRPPVAPLGESERWRPRQGKVRHRQLDAPYRAVRDHR